jgi:hypothetical protein
MQTMSLHEFLNPIPKPKSIALSSIAPPSIAGFLAMSPEVAMAYKLLLIGGPIICTAALLSNKYKDEGKIEWSNNIDLFLRVVLMVGVVCSCIWFLNFGGSLL